MVSNLQRYKKDLEKLVTDGEVLHNAMQYEFSLDGFKSEAIKVFNDEGKVSEFLKTLPSFTGSYQTGYSEALILLKQLLPDRFADFVKLYEKQKSRKNITSENYAIEDALQGFYMTRGWEKEKVVGPSAAIPRFRQQLSIIKSITGV
ncbi:MAG: hypothetical protein HQK96_19460 [Nitrospirae bacterium]|nr:hypothetical protein [Nitrospirota bacterium]